MERFRGQRGNVTGVVSGRAVRSGREGKKTGDFDTVTSRSTMRYQGLRKHRLERLGMNMEGPKRKGKEMRSAAGRGGGEVRGWKKRVAVSLSASDDVHP